MHKIKFNILSKFLISKTIYMLWHKDVKYTIILYVPLKHWHYHRIHLRSLFCNFPKSSTGIQNVMSNVDRLYFICVSQTWTTILIFRWRCIKLYRITNYDKLNGCQLFLAPSEDFNITLRPILQKVGGLWNCSLEAAKKTIFQNKSNLPTYLAIFIYWYVTLWSQGIWMAAT